MATREMCRRGVSFYTEHVLVHSPALCARSGIREYFLERTGALRLQAFHGNRVSAPTALLLYKTQADECGWPGPNTTVFISSEMWLPVIYVLVLLFHPILRKLRWEDCPKSESTL